MSLNIAIIRIKKELLLKWLDFEGGTIYRVGKESIGSGAEIDFVIEHPDLPEIPESRDLVIIEANYKKGLRGYKRVAPPKLKK